MNYPIRSTWAPDRSQRAVQPPVTDAASPHARVARAGVASLALIALAVTIGGCASARLETEWKSPAFGTRSLKGATVLLVCTSTDAAMRRLCEDQWASQLEKLGVKPVRGYQVAGLTYAEQTSPDEVNAAAKRSGAATVASTQLTPSHQVAGGTGTQVGVGVGGGFGGGGVSFGGIGISIPIGGSAPLPVLAASTSLLDVATNTMLWSGNATAPGNEDVPTKIASLTQVIVEALRKGGVL